MARKPTYLTTAQAAAIIGVTTGRIRQYVRGGALATVDTTSMPYVRDHLFLEDVVRAFVRPCGKRSSKTTSRKKPGSGIQAAPGTSSSHLSPATE